MRGNLKNIAAATIVIFRSLRLIGFMGLILIGLNGCSSIEKRSEVIPKKSLTTLETNLNFKQNWSNSSGAGNGKFHANLTLAKNNSMVFSADHKGRVFATDKLSGKNVWKVDLKEDITAGPAVNEGIVVIALSEAKLVALDSKTGKEVWRTNVSSEILATPKIHNKMVFVHALDGKLIALNSEDGNKVWQYSYSLPSIILRKSSSPVIERENVVVGLANGKLVSLLISGGQPDWIIDLSEYNQGISALKRMADISADPVVVGDMIYAVSYQGKLVAISIASGQVMWDKDASSISGIAVDSSKVYLADDKGHVLAFDKDTGTKIWYLDALEGRSLSKPIVSKFHNNLVIADEDGEVHFINLKTGKLVGRYRFGGGGVKSNPLFEKDTMFILGTGGKVSAVRIS